MAQLQLVTLAFDVVNQKIVGSYKGSAAALDFFRQGVFVVKLFLVQPATDFVQGRASYEGFDSTGYDGLRVGFWKDSTGTLHDSDANQLVLVDQLGWTYDNSDPDNQFYVGLIDLRTQEMADWIGLAKSKGCYFAINLVAGADLYPVYDQRNNTNATVYAATDDGTGNGINTQARPPLLTLPLQIKSPSTGHIFVMEEEVGDPPTIKFTCLNPVP